MSSTVFRDVVLLAVLGFVFMVVAMLPYLNPEATKDETEPPGNVVVTVTWPPGNTDVDTWVTGPGEPLAVGYSNHNGLLWNLLRDDLGTQPDLTGLNFENAYTRGVPAGEYVVNVHCYRCPVLPVRVAVEVALKTDLAGKGGMRVLATTSLDIVSAGQELTALAFRLREGGELVEGSMDSVYRPLRAASQGGDRFGNRWQRWQP